MRDYITICLILSCGVSLGLNWLFLVRIQILEKNSEKMTDKLYQLDWKVKGHFESIHRLELAQEKIEPATPIKPNNWDSMKQIFKKPARFDNDVTD